ncbi:Fibronectin/fibrinogen-binding protein [Indibacter alkaliphilus LW1]|uniref:Fibronectin/fibrinogen-binding protein n=1 Tax=Indibacter alkaliphilus (strain CCUG 57479 / KCTC 22604 / LW1) TaxID=1189612 RepID=S2DCP9_INDAL|nr:NFACT RNA binding domain-containing protein [Indibacter alkaliphilus]EOZ96952.1 Fibronectin/fibrinogen-binding protein [Indibacter alkaliphilus LW1]
MHFNYHFLRFLCPQLEKQLRGKSIVECFSQNKDELVIGCVDDSSQLYIRANLLPVVSALSFPEDFKRSKKNTISLFPQLPGNSIEEIQVFSNERAFWIGLDSGIKLVFKLHGTRSNILLYESGSKLPALLFRNELRDDKNTQFDTLHVDLDLGYERFETLEGNASKFIPTLGKIPRAWLKQRGYIEGSLEKKWNLINELFELLDTPHYSIVKEGVNFNLSLLPEEKAIFDTADPIQACNELFRYKVVVQAFEKEKNQWLKIFEEKKKRTKAYIAKTKEKLQEIKEGGAPSQVADIIMANLHLIPTGTKDVTLFNFYTQKEELIKLKPNQTPQKYAESLYRKSKNRKKEIEHLEENLEQKQIQLNQSLSWIEKINNISHFRELKDFVKTNRLVGQQKEKEEQVPFKRFEEEGFEILVGKSAKANDELLRHFVWKDDLWLHAKDVSGSHVILKYRSDINFPKTVIERAAELAAYYSKHKNESLAPVICTPAKFVRKVKGSAPGAVMVDKESVLMVSPKGPKNSI